MDNQERLTAFFEAENKRDWETYRQFLHPDVKWHLHSKGVHTFGGIDAYLSAIEDAYAGNAGIQAMTETASSRFWSTIGRSVPVTSSNSGTG